MHTQDLLAATTGMGAVTLRVADVKPDGTFRLDLSYFDYCTGLTMTNQRFDALFGAPPVGTAQAERVLGSLTLLGPTALYAAFTGVLLFTSSMIAGWAENWFVFHRLDSAIAWNPRFVARLGAARAQRWSSRV